MLFVIINVMEGYISTKLSEGTKLNEEIVRELDNFFSSIRPSDLRNTLLEIYHSYVIHEHQAFPIDFDRMAVHMHLLIDLLRRIEEARSSYSEETGHCEARECDMQWLLGGSQRAAWIREN